MKKIEVGDIFEIETNKGYGYFQCMEIDKIFGDLIKVYNKLYTENKTDLEIIISVNDFYFYRFPLSIAKRRNLVRFVGNIPIEKNFEKPLFMKEKLFLRGKFLGWHIINTITYQIRLVKDLSEEEKELSEIGIINDTYLKEKLESGWTPKNWI